MLKKEFKQKDVNRARNLIMGKTDASTSTQIGYSTKQKDYKEGDVWTEGRKTWTIKNGIKQTISKLDKIKKEVFMPLCCPECGNVMKKRSDKPHHIINKKCYDCVIDFEGKLIVRGEYEDYKNKLKGKNSIDILNELESTLLSAVNISNSNFVSEDGVVEKWVGGIDKEKFTEEIKTAAKAKRKYINKQLND